MYHICVCVNCLVVSDSCNPMDYSLSGSSVYGVLQARILEWVTRPSSMCIRYNRVNYSHCIIPYIPYT